MPPAESEYLSPVWRDGIFDGRVIFVTGGAGSIGSAQTRALVRLGANACIVGRNVEKTEAAAREIATVRDGAKVLGIGGCDVRNFDSVKKAVDQCVEQLGGIDFVIAGAAGNFVAPLSRMTSNAFKAVVDIDLIGSFNTAQATLPHLVRARPFSSARAPSSLPAAGPAPAGRIVFVSATFHYTGMPLQAHMSAAKAGVDALMGSVALEYGPLGVASNVIAPGPIDSTEGMTRLAGSFGGDGAGAAKRDGEQPLPNGTEPTGSNPRTLTKVVPSGRFGVARDIADATVFLFSAAGSYVNGHALVVDGASWRRQGGAPVGIDEKMEYPDYLLEGKVSSHVKSGRKTPAKL